MATVELSPVERAVQMYAKGSTPKEVSESLNIPEGTARTWKARHFQNENSVSNLETEIQDLKRKIQTDETEFQNLKRKIQTDETEFQKLKRKIQADETEIQTLKRKIQTDETEFQNLKRKIQTDETQIQTFETEFQDLKRIGAEKERIENELVAEREKHQKEIADNRQQYKLIHEAALLKALTDERKAIEVEKRRLESEAEAKLEREKAELKTQYSGTSAQQIQSEKLNASLSAKAEIAEAKAALVAEFDQKAEIKAQKAVEKAEAEWLKEKHRIAAKHQLDTEGWQMEKDSLLNDKKEASEMWAGEKSCLLNAKEKEIADIAYERDSVLSAYEKLSWKRKLPSLYDVVNITSNVFALWGFVELFHGVGVLAFIISSCTFYAIVQDVKKAHRGWSAVFGIIGATAVELYYSYSHLNLFETLLKGNEYPFNINYQTIALAFTILISGGSVYAVIMTALRSRADAEEKRLADIDAQYSQTK